MGKRIAGPRRRRTVREVGAGLGLLALTFLIASCQANKRPDYPTISGSSENGSSPVFPGDRTEWIRDTSLPDGSPVEAGKTVVKEWLLRNSGTVAWRKRFVTRVHDSRARNLQCTEKTPIPDTDPGKECAIQVRIRTPTGPGACVEIWKMTDAQGKHLFPGQQGLSLQVNVR